ncbi:MAG: DUF4830 domain-containing protein [Ruminococcus sp.]|nr:DUF4830 domain-containing protein [Ruminococcus sp.]
MFVLTLKSKIKKPKKTFAVILLGAVLIGVAVGITSHIQPDHAECDGVGTYSLAFRTDEDKQNFLNTFGLLGKVVTVDTVRIPTEFNEVYERYNKIQKKVGLDLDGYKGKTVSRFVYKTNDDIYVSVLCYRNKVVACHKCTGVYGDDFKSVID